LRASLALRVCGKVIRICVSVASIVWKSE